MVEKLWYNEYSKIIQHKSDIMTACDSAKGDTGVMGIKDNIIFYGYYNNIKVVDLIDVFPCIFDKIVHWDYFLMK